MDQFPLDPTRCSDYPEDTNENAEGVFQILKCASLVSKSHAEGRKPLCDQSEIEQSVAKYPRAIAPCLKLFQIQSSGGIPSSEDRCACYSKLPEEEAELFDCSYDAAKGSTLLQEWSDCTARSKGII